MNDDFIYKALPKVRKEFAESLYKRISVGTHHSSRPEMYSIGRIPRRLQVAMLILGVIVLVAWSQIRLWIRYVPIGDLWLIEFSSSTQQVPNDRIMTPVVPTPPHGPTMIIEVEGEEFMISIYQEPVYLLPDWVPEGFSATKVLRYGDAYEDWLGLWSNEAQQTIRLFAVPIAGGARPYAPPGMYEEVYINDQPAILVFGRLAPNSSQNPQAQRQWDETLGLQLTWSMEEHLYTLETLGLYLSADDLIRMAESMKRNPASGETSIP